MKHDFSAQFLRVRPPDTSFGQAWESLCYALLDAELNDPTLIRFNPPDNGVDILHRNTQRAYQCKSNERGAFGSLAASESIKSLKAAYKERESLNWDVYSFATNARYTGSAFTKVVEQAKKLGLQDSQVEFLGPEYWDKLCTKHFSMVADRFDYRVSVTKERVVEAFKNARYFDKYVQQYRSLIDEASFVLKIKNNRTPVEIEVPFSPELSVENCVDVVQELLGISLDWTNFHDLGTSAGPSVSLTIGQKSQGFSQKIKDLPLEKGEELQFWITIIWRDKHRDDAKDEMNMYFTLNYIPRFEVRLLKTLSYAERKKHTIERAEELIETMMWNGVRKLKAGDLSPGAPA